MTARVVGGTTDRNSLSARQANGAAMLVEADAAAVAVLRLVRLIAEGRELVRRLPVRKGVEQPQKLAVNAPRGRHARRQERQRPITTIRLPVAANLVSSGFVKGLVGPIRVAQRAVAQHITRSSNEVVAHGGFFCRVCRARLSRGTARQPLLRGEVVARYRATTSPKG